MSARLASSLEALEKNLHPGFFGCWWYLTHMRKLFALPMFNFFKATGCFSYLKPVFVVLVQSFKILLEGILEKQKLSAAL